MGWFSSPPARRGFFFTILSLILVGFIFVSVNLWAQAQQADEARAAERFRIEGLRTSLAMLDNDTLTKFANASMIFALNNLAVNLENHPRAYALPCDNGMGICPAPGSAPSGPFPEGTATVNRSIFELMTNGTTGGGRLAAYNANTFSPNLSFTPDQMKYTLGNFFSTTAQAARLLGYDVQWGGLKNFRFDQSDPWTLAMHFEVPATLTDAEGRIRVQRNLGADVKMDINGLTDPMIQRLDRSYRPTVPDTGRPHRNVYHSPAYNNVSDASVQAGVLSGPANVTEGLGWFFGPVTNKDNASFSNAGPDAEIYNLSRISNFIFITSDPQKALSASDWFGAVILENAGSSPRYANTSSYISGNCNYTVWTQQKCLYCIQYQAANDTAAKCPLPSPTIDPSSVPHNPAIPYAVLSGGLPRVAAHRNYHLSSGGEDIVELLIDNRNNATDLFGPITTPNYNHQIEYLERKFSDKSSALTPRSNSTLWDLTGPRDIAVCGYYVESRWGPSYLQRFTLMPSYQSGRAYSARRLGLESMVVGMWAGGKDDPSAQPNAPAPGAGIDELRSRLDYQFYVGSPGYPDCLGDTLKGMPGCKSLPMCSNDGQTDSPRSEATGRFTMTNINSAPPASAWEANPAARYNASNIETHRSGIVGACQ